MIFSKGKKEVTYVFFMFLLSKVFGYFNLLVFANLYIPSEYGKAAFVYSLFNIVLFVTCLGLPDTLVPWIIRKKDTSSVFYFLLIVNAVFFLAGIAVASKYLWVLPFVLLLPFVLIDHTARAILKADYKYHISQMASNIFVALILILAILFRDFQKLGIVLAFSIAYFIPIIFLFFKTKDKLGIIISRFQLRISTIKEYVKKGFSTAIIAASFAFLTWIDASILGAFSTYENVASYSIAGSIANVIASVPLSVMHFTLTRSASVKSEEKSRLILSRTIRLSYFFSLMFALLITSLIFLITDIFFPKYKGIEIFVAILSSGLVFYSVYNLIAAFLIGRLRQEQTIFPIFVAALFNIIFDIILIPKFGLYGITIATLFAHLLAFVLLAPKVGMKSTIPIIIATPALLFLSYYLGFYGILVIPLSIPLLMFLNLITKDDILITLDTVRRIFRPA